MSVLDADQIRMVLTSDLIENILWARGVVWLTRRPVKPEIAGSSPVEPAKYKQGLRLNSKSLFIY